MKIKSMIVTCFAIVFGILNPSPVTLAASTGQYKISYSTTLISNNHVGSNWSIAPYVNNATLTNNKTYSFGTASKINIKSVATEKDSKPDVGNTTISISLTALKVNQSKSYVTNVTVIENAGRNKGDKAVWKITYTIKRTK